MPGSTLFKAFVLFVALWAPFTQADSGWQPIQETIRKSEKDTRQYQAIRLDNGMTVLLVSDPQAGEIALCTGGAGWVSGRS
ncbi:peptidase M16 domain-containing protein [Enterobacter cancerogenus]|uniref:Peptidase M16 domain-containing protein n=1 Tax=Enterobacter cancerogenus TaxID=69218 RepID=A0A484YPJ2_9ENTR|nr:peptidase M16 domain-containing protein [Enterobacter cancerogenus]